MGYLVDETDETETDDEGEFDTGCVLFVLPEEHFASPPDWRLQCVVDPRGGGAEVELGASEVAPGANPNF